MRRSDLVKAKRGEIAEIARRHGVTSIRLFGSAARGDEGPESDIDFLIEVGPVHSPWFPGGLVADLEELLGCRVDVVEAASIAPSRRHRILRESVPI
jgi:predicted nucleotidyltransferase